MEFTEDFAEITGVVETATCGDFLDGTVGGLEEADGESHAQFVDEFVRGASGGLLEPSGEVGTAASDGGGELIYGDVPAEVCEAEGVYFFQELLLFAAASGFGFGEQGHHEVVTGGAGLVAVFKLPVAALRNM